MPATTERKLAAIMVADVAGFSALMERNETRTFERVRTLRESLTSPAISKHGGRVIKTTGDGFLAEFASATAALKCGIEIQRLNLEQEGSKEESDRLHLRIGINVGDIIIDGDDVAGDGVNIAARLEPLAPKDGICLSGMVREQVRDDLGVDYEDLGEQKLKNISRPVRAFVVNVGGVGSQAIAVQGTSQNAAGAMPLSRAHEIDLSLPDKPSLAVLPFTNMSGDPEQEYFADGVVDDIISALSRVRAFFVIARNSSFTYKGRAVDIKQVGRELGVRYVLEGSIRKAGNRVRIVGQLIEAENGRHIWADRFEGSLDDIFELQDRITESVVGAIEPNLRLAEIERVRSKPTANLQAYDLCLRALPNLMTISTKAANDEAIGFLHRAMEMDPGYSCAKAMCAYAYVLRKGQMWTTVEEVQEGLRLADEALADHRDDPITLTYAGHSLSYLGSRHEEGLRAVDRGLAINPNSNRALFTSGWVRNYVGDASTAIEHFQRAMRLNPLDPELGYMYSGLGLAYLIAGKYEDGLSMGLKSLQESPKWIPGYNVLIISLVQLGRVEDARAAAERMLKLAPNVTLAARRAQMPYRDSAIRDLYINALRLAGVPE